MPTKPTAGRPLSRTEAARRGGGGVPVFALVLAAFAAVVLVVAVVTVATRGGDDDGGGPAAGGDVAFGEVTVEGEALPPYTGSGEDPAVGMAAPTLVGVDPTGAPVTIDPAADGPMVIAFLAHWCPHCQAEVPRLVELADASGDVDGVALAAVATSSSPDRPEFPPGEWLASEDWPGPVLVDSEPVGQGLPPAAAAYGQGSFPFLVAVDAEGVVVERVEGEQGDDGLADLFARAGGGAP